MKNLTVTFHAKPYKQEEFENCFKVDVSDEAARILTANPYELNATDQSKYSELSYNLKCVAIYISILQSNQTIIHTEVVDIR